MNKPWQNVKNEQYVFWSDSTSSKSLQNDNDTANYKRETLKNKLEILVDSTVEILHLKI